MSDKTIIMHNADLRDAAGGIVPIKATANGDGTYSLSMTGPGGSSGGGSSSVIGVVGGMTAMVSGEMVCTSGSVAWAANGTILASGSALQELSGVGRVAGGSGYITGMRLSCNKKSVTPRIRVHLFVASNPTLSADNASWQEKYADIAKRIGFWDMPAMATAADATNSDMSRSVDFTMRLPFVCAVGATSLWFGLEALDAFAKDAGMKFSLTLGVEQN